MTYPATFEAKLGFDKIRALVEAKCATARAREMLAETAFCTDFAAVQELLEQTAEMQAICTFDGSFPQGGYVDVLHFIGKAQIAGAYLDEQELVALAQVLSTAGDIAAFFAKSQQSAAHDARRYPRLSAMVQPAQALGGVSARIAAVVDRFGRVKDGASPELQQLRRMMVETQQQVARRMTAILKQAQAAGFVDEGAEVSLRDGRAVIPVNAGSKRKVAGMVLDESATGKTAFIEPAEVVELNNRLKELGFAERREVIKILTAFTDYLRPLLPDVADAAELVCRMDFIRAKALFADSISAVKPAVLNEQIIGWRNARHPLLEAALRKEGKKMVPLDLRLTPQKHMLLISGPNAGGKSVVIKTVGLLQYMLQCGLLVPLSEASEAGIFEAIFIDIGDEQSLENDLSTYSSHLQSMKHFLRHANEKTLVLIDEFGTGTEPQLGGAIAEAVLASLVSKKSFGVITTHYANLKHFAGSAAGVENGAMLFDLQKIAPLFRLECGAPGSSFAFEIAQKIGLPDEVLTRARATLGDGSVSFDKSLRDIARDRRYWEEKRTRIKHVDKSLDELMARYEAELAQLQSERKRIIQEAKDEAKKLLAAANRQIENTIRGIKEAQAEREKTREIRGALSAFAQGVEGDGGDGVSRYDAALQQKMERLREQQQRREARKARHGNGQGSAPEEVRPSTPKEITAGDAMRVRGQEAVGEVVKVNDNDTVVLAVGNLYTTIAAGQLEHVSRSACRSAQRRPSGGGSSLTVKRLNFKPDIDVRGRRADEALAAVEELIDQAMMFGVGEVRILHGKGTGVLKEQIRRYLRGLRGISSVADEHVAHGGAGITVGQMR